MNRAESLLTPHQLALYRVMSEISEDCYCAGWMTGLEYAIWGALQDGDRRYGMGEMDVEQLERVLALSGEIGGWIVWMDDDCEAGMPIEEWGPRFLPMPQWLEIVAADERAMDGPGEG